MAAIVRLVACFMLIGVEFAAGAAAARAAGGATAIIAGVASDTTGAPIEGAAVRLAGPSTFNTTTDAKGAFEFDAVPPGEYTLMVTKPGYNRAVEPTVLAFSGERQDLVVRMGLASFSSLRTIASVQAKGAGQINTSQASVNVVSSQAFLDQSATQVTRVLSQIPGLQISFPSTSANAAAPGAITIPNIRGATSYETASLIDGHPISVGQYGDNVTTFLNTFMFDDVEVIKGPGADSPVINNAIGGTTNFRTKDPTLTAAPTVIGGFDSHGGMYANFGFSNTIGKVGFVVDIATLNSPSSMNGKPVYYDPAAAFGSFNYNGATFFENATGNTLPPTASFVNNQFPLVACCFTLLGNLDQNAQLLKLRYKFSVATTATVSYLGSQSQSDQNANTSAFIAGGQFTPGAGYTGSLRAGPLEVSNVFPGSFSGEFNNEPIFQAEVNTTLGSDAILARFYHASIERFQFQGGSDPTVNNSQLVTLYGTTADSNGNSYTFNGQPAALSFADYYQEPEIDKLSGGTFEYQHAIGDDTISFSADRVWAQSVDYSVFAGPFYSFNLPPGTNQTLTTYTLRGHLVFSGKLQATLTDYLNTYSSNFPIACANGCNTREAATLGTGVTFGSSQYSHNDPRLGVVYRPSTNSAVRFAMGSSIAPPFMGLLNQVASTPTLAFPNGTANNVALTTVSNGSIRPETAFGYDLGGDVRLRDGIIISGDVYATDLYNRFFQQTYPTGTSCGGTVFCLQSDGTTPYTGPPIPILKQINTNISNARFEGVELVVQKQPPVGFGYRLSGALQRGYYYALPPDFYCSIPGPSCIPSNYDQNLNIISGENTNGVGIGVGGLNYNGNMRIPYSQADGQVSYAFPNGAYALLGMTYYGTNNSLNEPPFGIGYMTLRYPLSRQVWVQVSGDNIFNAWTGFLPIYGGGVAIPLANGTTAATSGNVLGPATYTFTLGARLP